ncbi:MAG TPA: NAD(P) transhydrogenase subunit alpha [Cytophagales bacterium]|jgi:NAD(P) transhydrogenase subunit alpha|nr:NAD(P) transhydrogenase subunit alpha [Cytophagales bacterium]
MKIGFLKEVKDTRVAISPLVVLKYEKIGIEIVVEKGAGQSSGIDDNDFQKNATILSKEKVIQSSDIIISVNSESITPISLFKGKIVVSNFSGESNKDELIQNLKTNKVTAYDLSLIPRTTIAQSMDILSSMAGLAGYKAVIKSAELLPRMFPMIITAAGSIKPAKVVVLGAGVAGLQAIATAKRLGAIVQASDPRQAAREEVLSLGGKFIEVEGAIEDKSSGGYAVTQSKEYLDKQKEEVSKRIESSDVVITTAQVFGRKAPVLVSKELVSKMKRGSVIVDLASSSGGNCELTVDSKITDYNGVKIVGNSFLASELSHDSSNLFSNNVFNFLNHIIKDGKMINENDDSILSSCNVIK